MRIGQPVILFIDGTPVSPTNPMPVTSIGAMQAVSYLHTQPLPALNWAINHNLGFRPEISLLNSGGVEIEGEVVHISENLAVAIFTVPVSGAARCN